MSDRANRVRCAHVRTRIVSCFLLLLQSPLPIHDVAAAPNHPGKWTSLATNPTWPATAVNLVLLPGAPSSHHSRLLWWDHHAEMEVAGGLWGWTPPSDASVNAGNFPGTNFEDLNLESLPLFNGQPANIFCAGQTFLADGKLLVTGGNELFEIGIRSAVLFDPAGDGPTDENGKWTLVDSMTYRRWYPDNTLLPTGKVVTVSGNSYNHYATVGGVFDGNPDATTNQLQRFGVATNSAWELPSVVPSGTQGSIGPLQPVSDAAAIDLGASTMLTAATTGSRCRSCHLGCAAMSR